MNEQQQVPPAQHSVLPQGTDVVVGLALRQHPTRGDGPAVLIIDVDDELRRAHRAHLAAVGHRVAAVTTGIDALRIARACPIDVIIVDARVPDVDGWGFLAAVRADAHICECHVVLMSTDDEWLEALEGAGVGADACFAKGLAPDGVVNVVDRVLARRFGALWSLEAGGDLDGSLADVGVQSLLAGLCDTRRRGRLEVNTASSTWLVDFDDGVIARAAICAAVDDPFGGAIVDRSALLELLAVGDALWAFRSTVAAPPRTLGLPWGDLANDLCEQLNERRAEVRAAHLSRPRPVTLDAARLSLWLTRADPQAAEVADALVRGVPPRELIAACVSSPVDVDRVVQDLVRRSVLLLWPEPDEPSCFTTPAPVRPAMKRPTTTPTLTTKTTRRRR